MRSHRPHRRLALAVLLACVRSLLGLRSPLAPRKRPAAGVVAEGEVGAPRPRVEVGQSWPLGRVAFSLLPLAGSDRRKTIPEEVVPGRVWTFDQIQGVLNVNVPVRQSVIKLRSGGLWVHNPVAPTAECIRYMKQLEAKHGEVKHIVLGTLGLEHKATAGPFARFFPDATVWLQPGQWSFPFPIAPWLIGFSPGQLRTLPTGSSKALSDLIRSGAPEGQKGGARARDVDALPPWADEISFEVLGPLRFKSVGAFGESAFLHRASQTLLITDCIIRVDDDPPPIIAEDPRCLLYHARDTIAEEVRNDAETRRKGWRRIAQFGLSFFPSAIEVRTAETLSDAKRLPPSMAGLGDGSVPFAVYPWAWERDDVPSFRKLQGGLFVAPILQALILNRFPAETREWVDRVSRLRFKRIIPCHFSNDLKSDAAEFRRAFAFLDAPPDEPPADAGTGVGAAGGGSKARQGAQRGAGQRRFFPLKGVRPGAPAACDSLNEEFDLLRKASAILTRLGIVDPPKAGPLVGQGTKK